MILHSEYFHVGPIRVYFIWLLWFNLWYFYFYLKMQYVISATRSLSIHMTDMPHGIMGFVVFIVDLADEVMFYSFTRVKFPLWLSSENYRDRNKTHCYCYQTFYCGKFV